jgi:hypothetical protein
MKKVLGLTGVTRLELLEIFIQHRATLLAQQRRPLRLFAREPLL